MPILLTLLGATLLASTQSGCVRRRMTINSNPPGALCYIDNYEIGVTPCSTSFLFYGNREVRLVKDGYETLTVKQEIKAPWYQIPPLDFFSENFTPREVRDERTLNFTLTPQVMVPTEQLLGRAEDLRRGAQTPFLPVGVAPAAGAAPPPVIPEPVVTPPGQLGPQTLPPGGQPVERLPIPFAPQ